MAALVLDAPTERVAINLLRHLEWQAEGFSLVFLFADVGPSIQLAAWLNQRLVLEGRPIRQHAVDDEFIMQPDAAVDKLMGHCTAVQGSGGALWYAMQTHPNERRWDRARRLFLARMNERRFLLERDMKCPLVLVLPAGFRLDARSIAPDIWHVRALSEELRADVPDATPAYDEWLRTQDELETGNEWLRIRDDSEPEKRVFRDRSFLLTAWSAVNELLAAGRTGDADEVATSAVALSRKRCDEIASSSALRDLAISLDSLGEVAVARGDWLQAEAVYRESLELNRELVERLGESPGRLRNLLLALNNVGDTAMARSDWLQAEMLYRESLAWSRQLTKRQGGTPDSLRDVLVSLNNVSRVSTARGAWSQAESVYGEMLALSRQLVERLGGTPESLRDLSVSLNNIGAMAMARRDWLQAEAAYRESVELRRQLVEQPGGTPDSLRDLSVSLYNVGRVATVRGDWRQAEAAYGESLGLRRRLVERLGGTPESLEDLSYVLQGLAGLPNADPAHRAEALAIARRLADQFPDVERYRLWLVDASGDNPPPDPSADPLPT